MSDYIATRDGIGTIRTLDNASIPPDLGNKDWQAYQAWLAEGGVPDAYVQPPAPPAQVLSQDLMARFTADDAAKIRTAVEANAQFWLLWSAMQAQKDPMLVANERFLAGWSALTQVLGQPRMDVIAASLGVAVP